MKSYSFIWAKGIYVFWLSYIMLQPLLLFCLAMPPPTYSSSHLFSLLLPSHQLSHIQPSCPFSNLKVEYPSFYSFLGIFAYSSPRFWIWGIIEKNHVVLVCFCWISWDWCINPNVRNLGICEHLACWWSMNQIGGWGNVNWWIVGNVSTYGKPCWSEMLSGCESMWKRDEISGILKGWQLVQ